MEGPSPRAAAVRPERELRWGLVVSGASRSMRGPSSPVPTLHRQHRLFIVSTDPSSSAPTLHRQFRSFIVATGSVSVTHVPRPCSLATAIVPPFSSTFRRAIERPRPVPTALVEKYGSNSRRRASSSIPTPCLLYT